MKTEIASRNFVVDASQERVWRLVGKVILSSLPGMEEMEILDENNFRAMLMVKVSFLKLRMRLRGEILEMKPPDALAVNLTLEAPGGLFTMIQEVSVNISFLEQGRAAVSCRTVAENTGILFRVLFLKQARRFAQSTFEAIEKRLQDLA
jgi:carbon monoxide dehydrogenase subunit G